MGEATFASCESLQKVELKEGLIRIGSDAFYKCSSLEEIT
ncbi:MAG: leucine-rich repeat protein, partial [Aeriscardovia sp.]|nr:leucine-rich repeat protein [Aeriscardovia sp.]